MCDATGTVRFGQRQRRAGGATATAGAWREEIWRSAAEEGVGCT